jgi:hypothetical protein
MRLSERIREGLEPRLRFRHISVLELLEADSKQLLKQPVQYFVSQMRYFSYLTH